VLAATPAIGKLGGQLETSANYLPSLEREGSFYKFTGLSVSFAADYDGPNHSGGRP
jgi:hypothetical protein